MRDPLHEAIPVMSLGDRPSGRMRLGDIADGARADSMAADHSSGVAAIATTSVKPLAARMGALTTGRPVASPWGSFMGSMYSV